ncbi:M16 family metallopeptidase [Bacteroidota bacterium]
MDHRIYELPNGIRVVHKEVNNTKIAHCGFILDIGSRDENRGEEGTAHFWEHMVFKGTQKRKSYHIINRLESVGGELNAYTTKEKICFYASVLDKYFEKAIELLTDITFYSIFPEKEIEKERAVILEEMAMYRDIPEDAIQDDFDGYLFPEHSLGHNILGNENSLRSISKRTFQQFLRDNLDTGRIIFSVVGNFSFNKVRKLAERYISPIPPKKSKLNRNKPRPSKPINIKINKNITQSHCAIGTKAYSTTDPKRLTFFTLTNLLGGPAMNSRLNMSLREKHGFVYAIDASYTPYTDIGSFAIFFGTENKLLGRSTDLVLKEINRVRSTKLSLLQMQRTKNQIIGQLAMAEENNTGLMLMMGKSMLDLGRIDTLEEIVHQLISITSTEMQDIANEIFAKENLNYLSFIPNNYGNHQ